MLEQPLLRLLTAREPHSAVETALEFLFGINDARGVALFSVGERPAVMASRGIDQAALDWVGAVHASEGPRLALGRRVIEGDRVLQPIVSEDGLVGLLYLETAALDEESLERMPAYLAEAIAHWGDPRPEDRFLAGASPTALERRKLLVTLHDHEWNIARVARALGITRTTVYARMARHGIARRRVLKAALKPEGS